MNKPLLILSLMFVFFVANAQQDSLNKCDVITLRKGRLIYCRVKKIKRKIIVYTPCPGSVNLPDTVKADSVLMINYSGGTVQYLSRSLNKNKRYPYFSICGGVGMPAFSFASPGPLDPSFAGENESTSYDGYTDALTGMDLKFSFNVPVEESSTYFKFEMGYQRNPFDVNAYTHVGAYGGGNLPGSAIVPPHNGTNILVNSSSVSGGYTASKLLAGMDFSTKGIKTSYDLNFLFGAAYLTFPRNIHYTCPGPNAQGRDSMVSVTVTASAPCISFVFQCGVGMKHTISERTGLLFNIDFFTGKAVFPINIQHTGSVLDFNIYDANANTAEVSYCSINITLGLYYSIGK